MLECVPVTQCRLSKEMRNVHCWGPGVTHELYNVRKSERKEYGNLISIDEAGEWIVAYFNRCYGAIPARRK